jgi:hypothetical protein
MVIKYLKTLHLPQLHRSQTKAGTPNETQSFPFYWQEMGACSHSDTVSLCSHYRANFLLLILVTSDRRSSDFLLIAFLSFSIHWNL